MYTIVLCLNKKIFKYKKIKNKYILKKSDV